MTTPTTNDPQQQQPAGKREMTYDKDRPEGQRWKLQPYSVQQQPPPSASEVKVEYTKSGVPKACPDCGHPFHPRLKCYGDVGRCLCQTNMAVRLDIPAPSTGATAGGRMGGPLFDEGLLRILSAGGCRCDPPGVGEEFCTGHCHLRAEVAQLRADLAQANQNYEWSITRGKIWVIEIEKLRAQVQAMRPVVEAAQGVINCALAYTRDQVSVHAGPGACLELLRDAVAALDHAQPQQQEVPD